MSDFYDRPEVFRRYTDHRHSGVSSPNHVMEEPALWSELGPVEGLRVADLGCGDASIGPTLLAAGCASYLGVDSSAAMVAAAQNVLGPSGRIEQARIEDVHLPAGSSTWSSPGWPCITWPTSPQCCGPPMSRWLRAAGSWSASSTR